MVTSLRRVFQLWPSTYFLGALLLLSALLPLPHHNRIAGWGSICWFHNFTGLPCPGCGLTRAWVTMAHGQLGESLAWHPLGPLLFVTALGYVIWSSWAARCRPPFPMPIRLQNAVIGVGATLMLAFWVARLAGVFPLPGG